MLAWEDQYGKIKDGSILFSYSGWDEYWGDMERYMGNANNDPANYHWPGNISHFKIIEDKLITQDGIGNGTPTYKS